MTKYLNAKNGIEIWHKDGITQLLAGVDDPSVVGQDAAIGSIYMSSALSGTIYKKTGLNLTDWASAGSTPSNFSYTFKGLIDTPNSYETYVGKYPRVNPEGTGLEYDDIAWPEYPTGSGTTSGTEYITFLIPAAAVSGTYLVNFEAGRLLVGATGNKPDLVYNGPVAGLSFSEGKEEACYGSYKVPYTWNTVSDIEFTINFINSIVQTGVSTCAWKLDYQSYQPGEVLTDKITTTVDINLDLPNNAPLGMFNTHTLVIPPDDVNNPIDRGDILAFKFYRSGSDSVDTLTGEAVLITLMVEMQVGQVTVGD